MVTFGSGCAGHLRIELAPIISYLREKPEHDMGMFVPTLRNAAHKRCNTACAWTSECECHAESRLPRVSGRVRAAMISTP